MLGCGVCVREETMVVMKYHLDGVRVFECLTVRGIGEKPSVLSENSDVGTVGVARNERRRRVSVRESKTVREIVLHGRSEVVELRDEGMECPPERAI